jgi:hypothetical protein
MIKVFPSVLAFAAVCAFAPSLRAAVISWSSPAAITTDGSASDVLNTGGAVVAAEYAGGGNPTETVNGITFSIGLSDYAGYQGEFTGGLSGFTTNNAAYDAILNGFDYDGSNPNTLTITGLTPGTTYDVQLWSLDDRACCGGRTVNYDDGVGDASTVFALNSNVSTIGTFVADGTTQQIVNVNGVGQFQTNLNAFSVQAVPVVVPEPASIALFGIGSLGLCMVVRRRRLNHFRGETLAKE